jgi:type VI secretion system protein
VSFFCEVLFHRKSESIQLVNRSIQVHMPYGSFFENFLSPSMNERNRKAASEGDSKSPVYGMSSPMATEAPMVITGTDAGISGIMVVCLIILCIALSSCGSIETAYHYSRTKMGADIDVHVDISENANQNTPVAVDIVVIRNEKLLDLLKNMPAAEWFRKRDQIKRDYLEDEGVSIGSWEWVPGQLVPLIELPWDFRAVGAVVFANYLSAGAHRVSVDPFKGVTIRLHENDFSVEIMDD